jgi:HEAT repeat protein
MRLFEASRDEEGLGDLSGKGSLAVRPDPLVGRLIDVLASAEHYIVRMHAAEALYDVRDPAAVRAVITALDDPEGWCATTLLAPPILAQP